MTDNKNLVENENVVVNNNNNKEMKQEVTDSIGETVPS